MIVKTLGEDWDWTLPEEEDKRTARVPCMNPSMACCFCPFEVGKLSKWCTDGERESKRKVEEKEVRKVMKAWA